MRVQWNKSELTATDCYWLMMQWHSRVRQDQPFIAKRQSQPVWSAWKVVRWKFNMERSNYAVKILQNAIMQSRLRFEEVA